MNQSGIFILMLFELYLLFLCLIVSNNRFLPGAGLWACLHLFAGAVFLTIKGMWIVAGWLA